MFPSRSSSYTIWLLFVVHYVGTGPWWEGEKSDWTSSGSDDRWEEEWPSSSSSPSWSSTQPWNPAPAISSSEVQNEGDQHGEHACWSPEQVQMHMALAWDENVSLALQAESFQEEWQGQYLGVGLGLCSDLAPIPEDLPLPFLRPGEEQGNVQEPEADGWWDRLRDRRLLRGRPGFNLPHTERLTMACRVQCLPQQMG